VTAGGQIAVQKYRLISVDCPRSCFTAFFSLHLRWLDPALTAEDKAASKAWDNNWEPTWNPRIDFVNETEVRGAPFGNWQCGTCASMGVKRRGVWALTP
jgi:hypothetical protein